MMPICLTDAQMRTVKNLAAHVPYRQRDRFLQLTASFLRDQALPLNDRAVSSAATAALRKICGVADLGAA
jgi:hypothetical protein